MTAQLPELPRGHGLSIEAMVYYGDALTQPDELSEDAEENDESIMLCLASLQTEVIEYRKKHPSLDETIDLSFILT